MTLKKYNQKRHFTNTPEPAGKSSSLKKMKKQKVLQFVIQKHDATRLHYDFRLEMDGVLKSWAVPKGPSLNPDDKHLAMMVEDHPYEYRKFEGVIPEGNYGAGNVIIWDEGTYEPLETIPEGMTAEQFLLDQLNRGTIKIIMHGTKLKGEFALFRFKTAGEKAWLLKKHDDKFASKKDVLTKDTSVKSHLTVNEIGEDKEVLEKGRKAAIPRDVSPMLAELADFPFDNKDYLFEIKWDGYRAIAEVNKKKVQLYSRNGTDFNKSYPSIVESLEDLKYDAVFDGEVVVLDETGRSNFQLLQDFPKHRKGTLVYFIFDLLWLDGYDLRGLPLVERKKILEKTVKEDGPLKISSHIEEHGLKLYDLAKKKGFEGVMAKQKDSKYSSHRTSVWLKIKNVQTQEAVICGFTEPKGKRQNFGALILGVYDNHELRYIGHTGGGFDEKKLKEVRALLTPLIVKKSPFDIEPKTNTLATWVKPKIVCQVKFAEWTNEGNMRQPVFLGIRTDKKATEVTDEVHATARDATTTLAKKKPIQKGKAVLTNLNKVYWPTEGYTKGDLIEYYEAVADYILPYIKDRPISLNRFPNGINGESFFQKNIEQKPDWVKTVPLYSEHDQGNIHWLICNTKDTLLYIANSGSIEINPWNSRYQHPDNPDYMIIDLDPEGIPFKEVIRTAHVVKKILDAADADCFLKTSGKTGLHIFVPLKAKYTYDQTKQFAEIIANKVFAELPDITSVVRNPNKREHKIYVDFLQNRKGQTIAAPYCVRPVPYAQVSTPLEWKELTPDLKPSDFTIKNTLSRLKKKGDLWKPFLKHKGIHMLKSLAKLTS